MCLSSLLLGCLLWCILIILWGGDEPSEYKDLREGSVLACVWAVSKIPVFGSRCELTVSVVVYEQETGDNPRLVISLDVGAYGVDSDTLRLEVEDALELWLPKAYDPEPLTVTHHLKVASDFRLSALVYDASVAGVVVVGFPPNPDGVWSV